MAIDQNHRKINISKFRNQGNFALLRCFISEINCMRCTKCENCIALHKQLSLALLAIHCIVQAGDRWAEWKSKSGPGLEVTHVNVKSSRRTKQLWQEWFVAVWQFLWYRDIVIYFETYASMTDKSLLMLFFCSPCIFHGFHQIVFVSGCLILEPGSL